MLEPFPEFEFDDFTLREVQIEDGEEFFRYLNDPKVSKYVATSDIPTSIESARNEMAYWRNLYYAGASIYWAIADKATNKLIGTGGFNYWNKQYKRIEISYDIAPPYWNRGIATRTVDAITTFGINTLGAQRVQATVVKDNVRSIKVLEKCGYKREGLLCKYTILHGKSKDSYMYAKLSE